MATFDMGLVAIACQYGLLGLVGYTAFRTIVVKAYPQDVLMQFLGLAFVTFMLCLITITDLDKMAWVLFAVIVCLCNIVKKEQ